MRRYLIIIISLILVGSAVSVKAEDGRQTIDSSALTDEDKEIVEVLEILKLMEALKEMELMKDYHLFAEEGTDEKEN